MGQETEVGLPSNLDIMGGPRPHICDSFHAYPRPDLSIEKFELATDIYTHIQSPTLPSHRLSTTSAVMQILTLLLATMVAMAAGLPWDSDEGPVCRPNTLHMLISMTV